MNIKCLLFIILFGAHFICGGAHAEDPEIPLYQPSNAEALPSPVNEELPPLKDSSSEVTAPVIQQPTPAPKVETFPNKKLPPRETTLPAIPLKTVKDEMADMMPPRTQLSLPKNPQEKFEPQLVLEGGNSQISESTLNNIRFSTSKGILRTVLDFSTETLPWCHVVYNFSQNQELSIECMNVRKLNLPKNWKMKPKLSTMISQSASPMIIEDRQMTLQWQLKKGAQIKAFQLERPARLVIDIKP